MARLVWGAIGSRTYETGVDRGVLYVGATGVPWSGLTGVSESSSGGTTTPYYLDGVKYLNLAAADDYQATITAMSSPPEFRPCDGTASIQNGLFITEQKRKPFGFSYRTSVGNDLRGNDYGYKLHLVYNAKAAPTTRANASVSDTAAPTAFSWAVTTTPVRLAGYKPSSHFVVDSTIASPTTLSALEDILYGTDSSAPRLPGIPEVITLFA